MLGRIKSLSQGKIAAAAGNAVLLVGEGEPMAEALEAALGRYGISVATASLRNLSSRANALVPELVLVVGDAVQDNGKAVLQTLARSRSTSALPVALLVGNNTVEQRIEAFRRGVVALIPRTASADEMARHVADAIGKLVERPRTSGGLVEEATVQELLSLLSEDQRGGVLSVSDAARPDVTQTRIVLGGRPASDVLRDFLEQVKPLVGQDKSLRYTFHEGPVAKLDLMEDEAETPTGKRDVLRDRRILLVCESSALADAVVQDLRSLNATVVVIDGEGRGLERAQELDPELAIVALPAQQTRESVVLRKIRNHPRTRWSALLFAPPEDLWPADRGGPDLDRVANAAAKLLAPDRELRERVGTGRTFDFKLEVLGPARTLHALASTGARLHITLQHSRAIIDIDLAEGLLVGASGEFGAQGTLAGPLALAGFLVLGSGQMTIEHRLHPETANIMAPVANALAAATAEPSPIRASIFPESPGLSLSRPDEKHANEVISAELVTELQQLLAQLRGELPKLQQQKQAQVPKQRLSDFELLIAEQPVRIAEDKKKKTSPKRIYATGAALIAVLAVTTAAGFVAFQSGQRQTPLTGSQTTQPRPSMPQRSQQTRDIGAAANSNSPSAAPIAPAPQANGAQVETQIETQVEPQNEHLRTTRPEHTGETLDENSDEESDTPEEDVPRMLARADRMARDRPLRAMARYEAVLKLEPDNARALAGLVRTSLRRQDGWGAVRWARRLVDAHPGSAHGHVLLGDALTAVGSNDGARNAWLQALRLDPYHTAARQRLERSATSPR